MRVIYFDDDKVKQLSPVTLTRRASQISCGSYTLERLVTEIFKPSSFSYRKAKMDSGWKFVNNALYLNSRTLPWVRSLLKLKKALEYGGKEGDLFLLSYPWQIVLESNRILGDNLTYRMCEFTRHANGVYLGDNVELHKSAICDLTKGPIILDRGVKVSPFVVLRGPLYVGPETKIRDFTSLAHSSIGKVCKLAGEIEESVISGYTNKQHYGFVGHSYIGSWVNLGAGTTFSDLKNTYGEIKVNFLGKRRGIGTQFFGAVVGDYVKTAINTSVSSGRLIGPNSFLYGLVSEDVPPFVNYFQGRMVEFYLEEAYKVQKRMFLRRGRKARARDRLILRQAFLKSKAEREGRVERKEFSL